MSNNIGRSIHAVKYVSLYEASGYGISARRYLSGLKKSGIPLTWTPMVPGRSWGMGYEPFERERVGDPDMDSICNKQIEYDTVILHTVPEFYPFWIKREPNKKTIGYTVWETDKLPHHWSKLLNSVDQLLVPCQWNKKVFRKCGVTTPINVIPHIISDQNPTRIDTLWGIRPNDYVFYTIETWTARKAIWNTIKCYLNTFAATDPTVLVIKTSRQDFTRKFLRKFFGSTKSAVRKILNGYRQPARIKLITEELSDEDISNLHGRGDCYISLCRSEGWGLGAFDAAGYGKPVIITGWGGHLDYLPVDLAYLVNYDIISVRDKIGKSSYSGNQNWAEPRIDHASELMKHVFEKRKTAEAKGRLLQNYVRKNFCESIVTQKLISALFLNIRATGFSHYR
jgi:hypothetical protein